MFSEAKDHDILCLQEAKPQSTFPHKYIMKSPDNQLQIVSKTKITALFNSIHHQIAKVDMGPTNIFIINVHNRPEDKKVMKDRNDRIINSINIILSAFPLANIVCAGDFNQKNLQIPN